MPRYTDAELLDEIRQLADCLGHPPTLQELRKHGKFGAMTYYDRFGSWRDALAAAGFNPRNPQEEISDEDLLEELQRLSDEVGGRPSATQMNESGEYWVSTYRNHFGSWSNALQLAGFDTSDIPNRGSTSGESGSPVAEDDLIDQLRELGETLGGRPTWDDMAEEGEYSPSTYHRRFGSWSEALQAAGFEPPCQSVTREELIADLRQLAEELEHIPTMREMNLKGSHSPNTYAVRFGSWSNALTIAFDRESPTQIDPD